MGAGIGPRLLSGNRTDPRANRHPSSHENSDEAIGCGGSGPYAPQNCQIRQVPPKEVSSHLQGVFTPGVCQYADADPQEIRTFLTDSQDTLAVRNSTSTAERTSPNTGQAFLA
jgi:hypothetical protein